MTTKEYTDKSLSKVNDDYLVFDIETGTDPDHEMFMPEFTPDARLKDPDKIEADLKKQEDKWRDKLKLSALTGTVMAIGFHWTDEDCFKHEQLFADNDGEAVLLSDFWNYYRDVKKVAGHNIKGFDLPFLWRRSIKYGIKPLWNPQDRYNTKIVDTMELWNCNQYPKEMISLDKLAKYLGVGEKNGNGAEFEGLYLNEETRGQALDYLKNDVELANKVYRKMAGI